MSKKQIGLGIIGLGNMGASHARSILDGKVPGLELVAVADEDGLRCEGYPDAKPFTDGHDLIAEPSVDAVLIATPHFSHTQLGVEALRRGKHVLVEKPIAVHKKDCARLIAAYQETSGLVFAAMFNQRTDPHYSKLRDLIRNGHLGALQRIQWTITSWLRTDQYYASGGWRATWAGEGGGVLLNQCPHQLDLLQWLFGMPERVTARCQFGRFHDIEVEDSVTALLEYPGGMQGVFVTTTGESPGVNRLEVVGENGRVEVTPDPVIRFFRNGQPNPEFIRTCPKIFGSQEVWNIEIPVNGSGEQHVGILKNFAAAIQGEAELIAPGVEGIHSVELANAMLLSTFLNQPVNLPMDSEVYATELEKKMKVSRYKPAAGGSMPVENLAGSF